MKSFAIIAALTTLVLPNASAAPFTKRSPLIKRAPLNDADFNIANLAFNLEQLEQNLWAQALANFTAEDFAGIGLPGFYAGLELLKTQEDAHTAALATFLDVPLSNCSYNFPVFRAADVISFGQIVTSVGEGAYLGSIANITDPALRESAAQIIGNEARQNSYLRSNEFLNFFNAPNFDTPLTGLQAFSLASPYWDCPAEGNPPFAFDRVIPALNITLASTAPNTTTNATIDTLPGTALNVAWNATEAFLGTDVFLVFLSDVNSVRANLTQSGSGNGTTEGLVVGTTVLPELMNGTVFAVATIYDAPGPIPDEYNYAIGSFVVS